MISPDFWAHFLISCKCWFFFSFLLSVIDDDDSTITAGSIVTVTVTLKRESLGDHYANSITPAEVKENTEETHTEVIEEAENLVIFTSFNF